MDLPPSDMGCHRTAFKESCRTLVTREKNCCKRWIQIQGTNPNTGEQINRFDCVDNWGPLLQIENSQMQRQTGAAIESFRNETVMQSRVVMQAAALTDRLIELGSEIDRKQQTKLIDGKDGE